MKGDRGERYMRVSYSLLRLYERCPAAAKLIRVDKVRPEKDSKKRFITGSAGHRFLQRWHSRGFDYKTKAFEAGMIVDSIAAQEGIEWRSQGERNAFKWRAVKEASLLMKAVRHHDLDKIAGLQLEKRLFAQLPGGNHSIAGVADMVISDGAWVLEMKMSSDVRWADPDQLVFYGLIFKMAGAQVPKRLSFFLPLQEGAKSVRDIDFSAGHFSRMHDRINNVIIRWTENHFPGCGNRHTCLNCEVQFNCPERKDQHATCPEKSPEACSDEGQSACTRANTLAIMERSC